MWGTDVTLFSLTSLREESRSLQISDSPACVHLCPRLKQTCFSIVALIRPSEASAAKSQGPSLQFCRNYPLLFGVLPQELKILVQVLNSSRRNRWCNCTLIGRTHAGTSAIFDRLSVNTHSHPLIKATNGPIINVNTLTKKADNILQAGELHSAMDEDLRCYT